MRKISVAILVLIMLPTGAVGQEVTKEDKTITRITVHENGTAVWTIRVRTELETEAEVDAYKQYQERIRNQSNPLESFKSRMTDVVQNAENETERDMNASRFSFKTSIENVPNRWGVVEYRFYWSNFAKTEDNKIKIGDVFVGGFFLDSGDTLIIRNANSSYELNSVTPKPDYKSENQVSWNGQQEFATGNPTVEFADVTVEKSDKKQENKITTSNESTIGNTTPETTTSAPASSDTFSVVNLQMIIVGIGLIAIVVIGFVLIKRRQNSNEDTARIQSDEEKVIKLLEDNSGEMKQAVIANRLEWSESKTSRVLSDMESAGQIERIQIGRENAVRLLD